MLENKNKYYKTTFEVVVLSEEPITDIDLEDIPYLVNEGNGVLHTFVATDEKKLYGKEMAEQLYDAGSEPEFFNLDDNGEIVDDDD